MPAPPLVLPWNANSVSLCKSLSGSSLEQQQQVKKHLYDVCQRVISEELRLDHVIPALKEVTVRIRSSRRTAAAAAMTATSDVPP